MTSDPKETSVTIQDVDRESEKYMKHDKSEPSCASQEGQLLIPASNLNLITVCDRRDDDEYFCPGNAVESCGVCQETQSGRRSADKRNNGPFERNERRTGASEKNLAQNRRR